MNSNLVNRFEMLRMGYTSKQLDEELTISDQQLIFLLESTRQEYEMKKMAASISMALGGRQNVLETITKSNIKRGKKHG